MQHGGIDNANSIAIINLFFIMDFFCKSIAKDLWRYNNIVTLIILTKSRLGAFFFLFVMVGTVKCKRRMGNKSHPPFVFL